MAIYNGQLNALFDAKDMKCYFINFYCLSSGYFLFRYFALLKKAEPFTCPYAVIPLTAHLEAEVVRDKTTSLLHLQVLRNLILVTLVLFAFSQQIML